MSRSQIELLLKELYASRVRGDLEAACRLFSHEAKFAIASSGTGVPVAVETKGIVELRPLLRLLIRAFRVTDLAINALLVDGHRAAIHWQATIHSKITGSKVPTEFVDLVEVRDGQIASFREFFVSH